MPRVLVAAVLTAALLAGGCGADRDEAAVAGPEPSPAAPAPSAPSASASPARPGGATSEGPKPGRSGERSGGKIAPTPLSMARPAGSRSHLLTATALPAAAPGTDWTERDTGPEGTHRTGVCQETPLVDIGALDAVRRVFSGPEGSGLRVRQLVAQFADPRSAWRAHEVLRSWRADCEQRLDRPRTSVSVLEDVGVEAGTGEHYRVSYGPKQDTHVSGLGIVRVGRWLSVVEIRAAEGDVPDAWTARAVRRVAARFAG